MENSGKLIDGKVGRLAFHSLSTAVLVASAVVCLWLGLLLARVMTVDTEAFKTLFAPLSQATGSADPNPGEAFKRIVYVTFFLLWTGVIALWFGWFIHRQGVLRSLARTARTRRGRILFVLFAGLPLVALVALWFGGEEQNFYSKGAVFSFRDWHEFAVFSADPKSFALQSLALAVGWWLAVKGGAGRRVTEIVAVVLIAVAIWLLSANIGQFPPPDGFITDFDTHHKSAVLEPLVRHFLTGQPSQTLYGGYYAFGGTFLRFATQVLGADPFSALQWFFVAALATAFSSFVISLRLASGMWLPAFVALAAAISFAKIPFRGFLYLQVEPLRWLFPCLAMLALSLCAPALSAGRRSTVVPLFALAFAALKWNPETGVAIVIALSFAVIFLSPPRSLTAALRLFARAAAGLALGWLMAKGLSLATAPLWEAQAPLSLLASPAASQFPAPPQSMLFSLALFFNGVFVSPAPLLHPWLIMALGAVWLVSFGATRLALGRSSTLTPEEARLLGMLVFNGMLFLVLLIYYVWLSVPGTLVALSYPFFAGGALATHSGLLWLAGNNGRRAAPFAIPAIAASLPLLFLAPLFPGYANTGGHDPSAASPDQISATRHVCSLVDRLASGGDALYLGQNDWWYGLTCGRVFNAGLAPQALINAAYLQDEWKIRLARAAVVFREADMGKKTSPDYGRYGLRLAEYETILKREFRQHEDVKDWKGNVMNVFVRTTAGKPAPAGTGRIPAPGIKQ